MTPGIAIITAIAPNPLATARANAGDTTISTNRAAKGDNSTTSSANSEIRTPTLGCLSGIRQIVPPAQSSIVVPTAH